MKDVTKVAKDGATTKDAAKAAKDVTTAAKVQKSMAHAKTGTSSAVQRLNEDAKKMKHHADKLHNIGDSTQWSVEKVDMYLQSALKWMEAATMEALPKQENKYRDLEKFMQSVLKPSTVYEHRFVLVHRCLAHFNMRIFTLRQQVSKKALKTEVSEILQTQQTGQETPRTRCTHQEAVLGKVKDFFERDDMPTIWKSFDLWQTSDTLNAKLNGSEQLPQLENWHKADPKVFIKYVRQCLEQKDSTSVI